MNILCTICARSGSKGVPHKNLKHLIGKPLLTHSIKHARKSGLFNYIVVSTDSEEIKKISEEFGAYSWFLRPKRLSLDSSPKIPVIRHALQKAETYNIYSLAYDYECFRRDYKNCILECRESI